MLGGVVDFHFFAMEMRAANRMCTMTFLCRKGKVSIPRLINASAGEGVHIVLVVFDSRENTSFQKVCKALQCHIICNRLPL